MSSVITQTDLVVTSQSVSIVVNAPNVFRREDFVKWLNDPQTRIATWHVKGTDPDDFSDVIVHVDSDYAGDGEDMPEDIWRAICTLAYTTYCDGKPQLPHHLDSHIVVRLTNLVD